MNFFTFKFKARPADEKYVSKDVLGWQWALATRRYYITVERQVCYSSGNNRPAGPYYGVGVDERRALWGFRYDTVEYEGNHHVIRLGPFYIMWGD